MFFNFVPDELVLAFMQACRSSGTGPDAVTPMDRMVVYPCDSKIK
jgi:hypothetical protein